MPFLAYVFTAVLMHISYGIIKGLGKEKIFVLLLIFFYANSSLVILLLIKIGVGKNSMSYGMLFEYVCTTISGIFIIGLADWRKEADVIVNQSK